MNWGVALSPDGELFLCLDPENPGMGDALGDIAAVFRDRARGDALFVLECHHGPGATSSKLASAARGTAARLMVRFSRQKGRLPAKWRQTRWMSLVPP